MPELSQPRAYILGTGLDELERLGLQHGLWSDAAHVAWKRAGLSRGQRALDVGAGPGYASFDLAQMVTRDGRVVAVDESPAFIEHLAQQASTRGYSQLTGSIGDVQALDRVAAIEPGTFDMAYARWVLCFIAKPLDVVRGVSNALRPGGRFIVHDYFNYTTMTCAPRRAAITRVVEATAASWRDCGGDPDIVGRLPAMFEACGLRVLSVEVHQRVARAGESMFAWPDTWWRTYAPKLVAMGRITQSECDAVFADLDAIAASRTDFWVCPPMYELVGEKT